MNMKELVEAAEESMKRDLVRLADNLGKIRSNQISLKAIEELLIEQQGKKRKIRELAILRINPNNQLVIQVLELKDVSLIKKAILESQLGYQQIKIEKNELHFSLASMTGEARQQLVKKVKEIVEQGKASLRISRQKIRELIKKNKNLSQNEQKIAEKEIEKVNEKYLNEIKQLHSKKEKELILL